jgi:ribonucleoside-triphosphate reductase (thioredoxin)
VTLLPDGTIANPYQNFIAVSRYARWLEDEGRRETWEETVSRYIGFMQHHLVTNYGYPADDPVFDEVKQGILDLDVMPSMRALMTAGPALERSNIAGYNCAFVAVDDPRAFDESLYVAMNGTGVGFSVERRYVDQLPAIPLFVDGGPAVEPIVVEDSKEGWAKAYRDILNQLWLGITPKWDLSNIRPAGAKLKTFGGRASGPGPLDRLFRFTVDTFKQAEGRRLTSLEAHDIMTMVGDCVVSGGVRRAALISLSDLNDFDMAKAKSGNWWEGSGHRALANNSAVYMKKPAVAQFLREWRNLIESNSGERGIYNLAGAQAHANALGRLGDKIQGTNPCGEILLRSLQFCNLTEVVVKSDDTLVKMKDKVRLASIVGTWQSSLTNFPYLRDEWRQNCEEERLLGVSLTGIYGHRLFNNPGDIRLPKRLRDLRHVAHETNQQEAARLGINPSAAVTTVKPSGTVSQLTGVSSGIHPWHSEYYIRTVRGNNTDPLTQLLKDWKVPNEPDVMKPDTTTVFSFPIKAPKDAVTRSEVSALDHLALWAIYREHWTDHNPSVTINVRDEEWMAVGTWVWENWQNVGGISFLPYSEHVYAQAPYQEIDQDQYEAAMREFPTQIRWADLSFYELMDSTSGSQSLACAADGCDVVDIGAS